MEGQNWIISLHGTVTVNRIRKRDKTGTNKSNGGRIEKLVSFPAHSG